jgi:hypothetical protein
MDPTKWQIGIPVSTGPPATIQNDVSESGAILTSLLYLHLWSTSSGHLWCIHLPFSRLEFSLHSHLTLLQVQWHSSPVKIEVKTMSLILYFVDRAASLYNLLNKTNPGALFFLVYLFYYYLHIWYAGWMYPTCMPDVRPHRLKNNRCRTDTVTSPDDGHIVARNV